MPVTLTSPPEVPVAEAPPRKRWTREECERLAASGMLDYDHIELIDGDLIDKMGKNRRHVAFLRRVQLWLDDTFGRERVNSESPIRVAPQDERSSDPEPDLVVLYQQGAATALVKPGAADICLLR